MQDEFIDSNDRRWTVLEDGITYAAPKWENRTPTGRIYAKRGSEWAYRYKWDASLYWYPSTLRLDAIWAALKG
jgi:hypothetical protein